jgi:ribonuclease Z
MTTTITITGTGCPIPDAERAGPGVLVRHDDVALQFDAGRSTVQRLAAAGLWPTELDAVFVTHHHSDHLTGLQDLVLTRWVMDRTRSVPTLPIVAPEGPSVSFLEEMLQAWRHDIAVRSQHAGRDDEPDIDIVGFELPVAPTEVWRGDDVIVKAGRVRHEPVRPAVGFRVETPDGVVAISGDTIVCDEVAELADGADVLIYEAMRFEEIEALPDHRRFILDYHADTRLIGAQASGLGVSTLVLTHLIPAPDTAEERRVFVDDIRAGGYEGELIVADDLYTVTLGH